MPSSLFRCLRYFDFDRPLSSPSKNTFTASTLTFGGSAMTMLRLRVPVEVPSEEGSNKRSSGRPPTVLAITMVRLVGRMLNKKQQVTDVSFVLDDGTGRIDMKRWDNETFDTEEMKLVKDGDYVIVIGGLKDFQGKRQVTAFSVRSLSQPQLIANTSTRNQAPHTSYQAPTSSASGNSAGKELSDLVMSVFLDPVLGNLEHGVSLDQVASRLNLSLGQARLTVLDLVDLGNLYATIDDDHYKSIMNG